MAGNYIFKGAMLNTYTQISTCAYQILMMVGQRIILSDPSCGGMSLYSGWTVRTGYHRHAH